MAGKWTVFEKFWAFKLFEIRFNLVVAQLQSIIQAVGKQKEHLELSVGVAAQKIGSIMGWLWMFIEFFQLIMKFLAGAFWFFLVFSDLILIMSSERVSRLGGVGAEDPPCIKIGYRPWTELGHPPVY